MVKLINRADLLRLPRNKRIKAWFKRKGFSIYYVGPRLYDITLFRKSFRLSVFGKTIIEPRTVGSCLRDITSKCNCFTCDNRFATCR